jgi:hypothetical protein
MADSVLQTRGAASASLAALPVIIGSDTYPVAVAVRYLKRSENIGYAAVYIIFAVLLFLRLSFPRKPMSFHRQTAYQLFVLMCISELIVRRGESVATSPY